MATNEIQGSQLLVEISFDNLANWKTLVCQQGGKISSTVSITNESTKCGNIPGIGVPDWTADGDAVANLAPLAAEASLNEVMAAIQNVTPVYIRVQSPPHGAVLQGAEYYRLGKGYFTKADEDMGNGSVVKFAWSLAGVGSLAFVKVLGFYTQPITPIAIAVGSTLAETAVPQGGTPPYTYQWKKGGVNITGATSQSYSKANAQTTDSGTYTVAVTDAAATTVTSAGSVVTVS